MIRRLLKKIYYSLILLLPTKAFIKIEYFRFMKKLPNLEEPKMFCEKLQCLKLNKELEEYYKYADKYEVREFIRKVIGEEYLNKLIGVYESFDNIDFYNLPSKFILKCTQGSGYNIVCAENRSFNLLKTKKAINKWMKTDFYKLTKEPQYKNIKPRIICEEYLEDKYGNLVDYKIFCFNGKPEFIEVDIDKYGIHNENFYNVYWKNLNIRARYKGVISENTKEETLKPQNLEKILNLSRILSKDFKFVRVDFYIVDEKIIFGELTFIPGSGFELYIPQNFNYKLAKFLE